MMLTEETETALRLLDRLQSSPGSERRFREGFIEKNRRALVTGGWDELAEDFTNSRFVGPEGEFVFIAPYVSRRLGSEQRALTGIHGRISINSESPPFETWLRTLTGELREPVSRVLPFRRLDGFGMAGMERGEAFLVPDGWRITGSTHGPALNDMDEQHRRLQASGFRCLRKIFEPDSAQLVIQAVRSTRPGLGAQVREFQYHEAAHASGLGLKRKLDLELLRTPWYRAVEEWRADGVEFALLGFLPDRELAGRVVAANLALRFGVDAHRGGGMDRDTDVNASWLTFDRLLESGLLDFDPRGRLRFRNQSYTALANAVEMHAQEAVRLTRQELALEHPEGLWGLYGSIPASRASRVLFQRSIISPCAGAFQELQ